MTTRKRGRPVVGIEERRDDRIPVGCSMREKRLIQRTAAKDGQTAASWLRDLGLTEIRRRHDAKRVRRAS